jgi:nitroreductase
MLHKNIIDRKSIVCFDSKLVEKEILTELFEAARWAPSSNNNQPWNFIVGEKNSDTFDKILQSLVPANALWAAHAPVLMVTVAQMKLTRDNMPNKYAWHDTAMAYSNLVFQALSLGLMVHPMGGFSSEKINSEFNLPADFEPVIAIALGYMGDCKDMPDEVIEKSKRNRTRKSLNEFVFCNTWFNPFFEE